MPIGFLKSLSGWHTQIPLCVFGGDEADLRYRIYFSHCFPSYQSNLIVAEILKFMKMMENGFHISKQP